MNGGRTRWIVFVLAVFAIAAGVLFAGNGLFLSDDPDLSRSKPSELKTYVVAVAPESEPLRQGELHTWLLTLTTPDGRPVESASIAVDGGMPRHGHGLPTSPRMTKYLGTGRYRIEGVKFNMGGWWELKFAVSAPPGEDRAVFNVLL